MPKLQEFTGWIISKEQKKVYDKGEWYGNPYFKLTIIKEENKEKLTLFVYSNLVNQAIFKVVEESQYLDKNYSFCCEKRTRGFVLYNWQELQSNGSDLNKSRQIN